MTSGGYLGRWGGDVKGGKSRGRIMLINLVNLLDSIGNNGTESREDTRRGKPKRGGGGRADNTTDREDVAGYDRQCRSLVQGRHKAEEGRRKTA